MKNKLGLILAITGAAVFAPAISHADDDDRQQTEAMVKQFGLISPEEAGQKALAGKTGVIEDIELDGRSFGKGFDYEVEFVDADGVEWEAQVDAKTGEVRSMSKEWF